METSLAQSLDDPSVMSSQYWQVVFDDDTMLIDNKMPGAESGWHRLRRHLKDNPKRIQSFTLHFMGRGVTIQGKELEDADGIFCVSQCMGLMGSAFEDIQKTIGTVKSGVAYVYHINQQGFTKETIKNVDKNDPRFIEI